MTSTDKFELIKREKLDFLVDALTTEIIVVAEKVSKSTYLRSPEWSRKCHKLVVLANLLEEVGTDGFKIRKQEEK